MAAALALVGVNIADALLLRLNLQVGEVGLNPLVPPLMANVVARGLLAVALILTLYMIKRPYLLWWLDFVLLLVMGYHSVGYYMSSFPGTTP